MKILVIINDAPYGTEKAYNALRLAMSLQKEQADAEVLIFLMADAVTCALPHQTTPDGYYNLVRMLKGILTEGGQVEACGTCTDARGIKGLPLTEGAEISTMRQLAQWGATRTRVSPSDPPRRLTWTCQHPHSCCVGQHRAQRLARAEGFRIEPVFLSDGHLADVSHL